jgi:hypothetical protein
MVIISPQGSWLQPGEERFITTRICFLATDDNEALIKAHVEIQQKLLSQLPADADKKLKFKLKKDVPAEHCPIERPAS